MFGQNNQPENSDITSSNQDHNQNYTLEDMVYEQFPEATQKGGQTYDTSHFLNLFEISESKEAPQYQGHKDNTESLLLEDPQGKALYGLIERHEDEITFDIKIFGDTKGVERYLESLPTEGYVEGIGSVQGTTFQSALTRLNKEKHPLDQETDTGLSEPGENPDEGFTNTQAERIKNEVLQDNSI